MKNAALSQQAESSGRAELFPALLSPKQGVSAAGILPVQWSWENFKCHLISQSAVARGEMKFRMAGAHRRARETGAVSHLPNSLTLLPSVEQSKEHLHTHLSQQIHGDVVPGEWFSGGPWA